MLNIDILGVTNGGAANGASPGGLSAQSGAQSDTPSPVGGSAAAANGQQMAAMAAAAEPLTAAAVFAATGLHPAAYPAASKA